MYQSLRLRDGGGVEKKFEKANQLPNTATIVIGLGGTGKEAVRTIKKSIYNRIKEDNFDQKNKGNPEYKHIKFLAIDTDKYNIDSPVTKLDLSKEFFSISLNENEELFGNVRDLSGTNQFDWINKNIANTIPMNPHGAVRQIGRFCLCKRAKELYDKFKEMIVTSTEGLPDASEINIYIVTSVCGSTGSGSFADVCYIMRQVLSDWGCQHKVHINGFLFLPDVNISHPAFPKEGFYESALKKNAYAALKEIDYLMNIPANGDTFKQEYMGGLSVEQKHRPVDNCYLLSATLEDGTVIENGYNYVMNLLADYVMNFVAQADEGNSEDMDANAIVKGMFANVDALLNGLYKEHGANYVYNVLGASSVAVPYEKLGAYLATRVFETIKYIQKSRPAKSEVEDLWNSIRLASVLDKISSTKKLTLNPSLFEMEGLRRAPLGTMSAPLAEYCNAFVKSCEKELAIRIDKMGKDLASYEMDSADESIIGTIFKYLIRCTENPAKGPYYAMHLIEDENNLSLMIDNLRGEIEDRREKAKVQGEFLYVCEQTAHAEFSAANVFIEKKKTEYVLAVEKRYNNAIEVNTYTALLELLDKVKMQLNKLAVEYFKKLTNVFDGLIETFLDNAEYLNAHGMGDMPYTWSIVDVESIKGDLDAMVDTYKKTTDEGEVVTPYLTGKLIESMCNQYNMWADEDESKISELISHYISEMFNTPMSKTVKQYLQEKYGTREQDLIRDIAKDAIEKHLVTNCVPLFYNNSLMLSLSSTSNTSGELAVLSVPKDDEDIWAAANLYKRDADRPMMLVKNAFTDYMYLLKRYFGIPLFAHKELKDWEEIYYEHLTPGIHLYEGEEKNWRNLPSPIPATYESSFYQRRQQDEVDRVIALYDRAKTEGIIVENFDAMMATINVTDECDLGTMFDGILTSDTLDILDWIISLPEEYRNRKISEVVNQNMWRGSHAAVKRAVSKLKDNIRGYKEKLVPRETLTAYNKIERRGKYTNGFDSSLRDDFVKKPIFVKLVEEEINKFDKMNALYKALTRISAKLEEVGYPKGDFISAIMHSVIFRDRSNYVFKLETDEQVKHVVLTKLHDEYATIPVYRAFVNYLRLDSDVIEQITKKTDLAKKNVTDEIYENVKIFREFYKGVYEDYINETKYFENEKQVVLFLDELRDSIEDFLIKNR